MPQTISGTMRSFWSIKVWCDDASYLRVNESVADVLKLRNGLKNTQMFADRVVNIPSSVRDL